ncbi:D-amino acid dehydrogenase [Salinispirillum sp. LH 10-3-1]|uniref:D-amino acid dehydrogenase n=1 Tax=Salinispirillum sp. LH 10-3-1 TaxID=2952525 RepID=A0AB38YE97_9GAMM
MRIVILGSGIIGVTSAWYLAKAGHEVTVIDRQDAPALETSFANAGQISPGYSAPWAAPGVPLKAVKWLLQDLAPLRVTPQLDPFQWQWMTKMLSNCTGKAYAINKSRMLRVAEYSRDCFIQLRQDTGLNYDNEAKGLIQLFRTHKQLDASAKDTKVLEECNVRYERLSVAEILHHEPGLIAARDKLVGGLRLPGDETGDCFKFTQTLANACKALGVQFRFNTTVDGLVQDGDAVTGVRMGEETLPAERVLVALGSFSRHLLKPLGFNLPIYPVKGSSLTMPVTDGTYAPVSTVMDETYKIALTRLGDRIRVGGTAELSGYNLDLPENRKKNLNHVVQDLFPGGGDLTQAEYWTGLRPMTPDGTPIIGPTRLRNLFLNTGHGTLGWTMSLGSAKLVADLMTGRRPEIDPEGLDVARYQRGQKQETLRWSHEVE